MIEATSTVSVKYDAIELDTEEIEYSCWSKLTFISTTYSGELYFNQNSPDKELNFGLNDNLGLSIPSSGINIQFTFKAFMP